MRRISTGRLAARGLAALAGLLLAVAAVPASAEEGVVRISDRQAGISLASHAAVCDDSCGPSCETPGDCCPAGGCCSDGCGSGCACGSGCGCGKSRGLLSKFFGKGKNCRCGKHCQCGKGGSGGPIGHGYCSRCGSHGLLYGPGYCAGCCGALGIPCLVPGIPIPGIPVPGYCGPIAGSYARVYAVNPYYHDFRDGSVYAAQGYNAPISVPLAPNVDYQMNYGWGMPSSRLTPISRVQPSPYAVQPTYAVPPGYMPAGAMAGEAVNAGEQ